MPQFPSLRFFSFVVSLVLIISAPLRAQSVVSTWNTTDDNWSDPAAWLSGTAPTSGNSTALIFGGSAGYNANNDIGNFTLNQIQFASSTSPVSISASSVSTTITLVNSDAQLGAITLGGAGSALISTSFTWSGEDSITNSGSGLLSFTGPTLAFGLGTKQTFTNSGSGTIALADGVTYATTGTGTGLVLNFINNNSTFNSFSIGNMGTLSNVTVVIGGTGTVNFVTGGNTSTGDLFSNTAFLNVLSGATFDFNGNGETFGGIEGAGTIHTTVGMESAGLGNYNFSGLFTGTAGNITVDATNTYQTISGAANNYTGATSVLGGHLIVGANAPNGGTGVVGALGNSTTAINVGDTTGALSSFLMIGTPGVTIGRNILVQTGNTGVSTIGGLNTSGTAIFSGNITMGTASKAAVGVTLSAAPGGTVQFTGNLLRATTATAGATDTVTVTGGGTVVLSGINTFTGATTVNAGTLVLDNSTNNGNKISATAALTLNGGSLSYLGSSAAPSSQSVAGLTLGNSVSPLGGGATFAITTGANQNATFSLGVIARNAGATIDFEATNTGTGVTDITTSIANVGGILGAYATFGQGDWAANDGNGNIVAFSTVGSYSGTLVAGNQTSLAVATAVPAGGASTNSLRLTSGLAMTFSASADTLTLTSGGLLVIPGTGATSIGTTTTRGVLASGTGELVVQQESTLGTLTINSAITATTLTKSGAGTLTLTGTNSMTNVIIDAGTLSITATGNLGAATSTITLNGGTLAVLTGSMGTVASGSHTVIIGPDGATLNFGVSISFSGNGFSGTGTVTKTGAGIWSVGANGSTFSGAINLNQGTLSMTSSQLNSSGTMSVASGATFNVNDDGVGNWFTNNGTQFLLNGSGVGGTAGAIHLTDQTQATAVFADPTSTLLRDAVLQSNTLVQVDNGSATGSTSTFVFGGNVSGPGALIKGGSGVLALTGRENTYSGGTVINGGILRVSGGNDRLPTSTSVTLGSGAGTGGTFQLFGNTQTVAGLTTGNAGENDEVTNGNSASTSPSILTVNLASGSQTYDGTLGGIAGTGDNSHTNNNLSFVKDGPGTLTLTGINTYDGSTTVANGTLVVGGVNALGNNGASATADNGGTTVNSGATLDMNGTLGVNEVITLNGSGVSNGGALINSNTSIAANISNGVSSLSLNGSTAGWSSTASVTIGASGSGTQATATPLLGLATAGFNINGGSGYSTTQPTVTVTGGGGTGAVLVAGLGLTTASYNVTASTTTYMIAPTVTITGQGSNGTAATATAVLDGQGHVIGITLTNPGTGFTAAPTITFTGGTVLVAGTAASATTNAIQFAVTSLFIVNPGSGFTSVPTITITGGTPATGATVTYVDGNFALEGIAVTNNGSGYTSVPTVTITGSTDTATANLTSVNLATDSSIGGAGNLTISSVVTGPGAFNKVGAGTTALTGANTYTGATNITAGNLQVGVAGLGTTGTGNVTVNGSGAVLSGTGTVNGSTNVILGTIKPGDNGGASTGTLNMQSLTFSPTSASTVAVLQITGSTANSNLSSDKIVVNGVLTLSANSNIMVDGTGYTPKVGDVFDLLDWTSIVTNGFNFGTNLRTGANSAGNEGNLDLPDLGGTGLWNISTSSNDLVISVVSPAPEPSRAMLLMLGVAGALLRRRRR